MNKELIKGLYPEKSFREDRVLEIEKELSILTSNRQYLEKQINSLVYELSILENLDKLEQHIKGEINIQFKEKEND